MKSGLWDPSYYTLKILSHFSANSTSTLSQRGQTLPKNFTKWLFHQSALKRKPCLFKISTIWITQNELTKPLSKSCLEPLSPAWWYTDAKVEILATRRSRTRGCKAWGVWFSDSKWFLSVIWVMGSWKNGGGRLGESLMLSHMGIMKNCGKKLAKRTWSNDGFHKCLAVASTSTQLKVSVFRSPFYDLRPTTKPTFRTEKPGTPSSWIQGHQFIAVAPSSHCRKPRTKGFSLIVGFSLRTTFKRSKGGGVTSHHQM